MGDPVPTAEGSLPPSVARLLWDMDLASIDRDRDRELIFERVMSRGTWDAMRWLRRCYPREALAAFVRAHGARRLSPRDLAYWALVCGLELDTGAPGPGGGRPGWAGP